MPADEKDSAATNRLLDLLRSQQTGKSTTEGNASGTVDANTPPASSDSPTTNQPASPAVSSSIVPDSIIDDAPPADEKSAPGSSDEIRAKLGNLAAKKPSPAPVEESPEEPAIEAESTAQGIAADLMDTPVIVEEVAKEKVVKASISEGIEEPGAEKQLIDPSYFQIHQDVAAPNKVLDLLYEISNWAFGIRKKRAYPKICVNGIISQSSDLQKV